jgi:hypothetical protein
MTQPMDCPGTVRSHVRVYTYKIQVARAERTGVNREVLRTELADAFGGSERTRRIVARTASDLADSGRLEDDMSIEVTPRTVISNLEDAPEEYSLVERWNWWVGSLDLSHGGYQRFFIRTNLTE